MDLWMFTWLEMLLVGYQYKCMRIAYIAIYPVHRCFHFTHRTEWTRDLSRILLVIDCGHYNQYYLQSSDILQLPTLPLLGSASFGLKAVWCRHHQQGSSRWHCNPRIRCSISDQNRRAQESMTPMSLQHLHKLVTYTTILLGYSNSKSFDFNLCLNPGRGTLITLDIHATFGSAAKVAFAQVMGTASLVSPQRMGTWNPIRIQVKQGNWNTIIWTKQNRANTNKHVW